MSGAGKTPSERTHFSEFHGSLSAYGVFGHRHGAEIEQGVGGPVTFTPHLLPLDRGILATIYVRVAPGHDRGGAGRRVRARVRAARRSCGWSGASLPEIKHVAHTNFCDIGWRVDPSGRVILVSVIDNLLKGASGQAVQNMNVMLGLDERDGACGRRSSAKPLVAEVRRRAARGSGAARDRGRGHRADRRPADRAPLVVVHGGGKEIDAALKAAGIEKRQVDGLRITDEATLDVVVAGAGRASTRGSSRR